MLIRLVSHPEKNSDHIDKLIYIEGLPESMIYRVKDGKKFLKEPWQVDNDENMPNRIQNVFFKNPVEVWFELPKDPTFPGQQNTEYRVEANCFKIDYQTRQGEEMWKQIEKLLDRETPRDMEIPKPAVVGDRRDWFLEAADVPSVVLEGKASSPKHIEDTPVVEKSVGADIVPPKEKKVIKMVKCGKCGKELNERGLLIHTTRIHGKEKEAVNS